MLLRNVLAATYFFVSLDKMIGIERIYMYLRTRFLVFIGK